jgi:Helix-turn-helix domain
MALPHHGHRGVPARASPMNVTDERLKSLGVSPRCSRIPAIEEAGGRTGLACDRDGYATLKGLAQYASVSVRTLRGYLTRPVHPLPHYRLDGKILVRRSEFDAWLQQFRQVQSGPDVSTVVDEVSNSFLR